MEYLFSFCSIPIELSLFIAWAASFLVTYTNTNNNIVGVVYEELELTLFAFP